MIPTFVINLDRDAARLAHMQAECARVGLAFERFAALRGDALPDDLKLYFAGVDTLSPGEIGCYASHLALLQRIGAGAAPGLILEDDVRLPDDFAALLDSILAAAPADWDFVRLSNTAKRGYAHVAPLAGGRFLSRYSQVPGSTGGYLVSAAGARKFTRPDPRRLPIDQDLKRSWVWGIQTYGVTPTPLDADIFEISSIDAMAQGVRKDVRRLARMRRARAAESGRRHGWTIKTAGWRAWAAMEAASLAAMLTPKQKRPALLARAAAWTAGFAKR